jgi:hypothetical protein
VECKGVNITQLGVSSIFSFLQETSLRGCENRNKEPRQVQDCRIEVAPLQPMQHDALKRSDASLYSQFELMANSRQRIDMCTKP